MHGGLNRALRAAGVVLVAGAAWSADGGALASPAASPPASLPDAPSQISGAPTAPLRGEGPRVTKVWADATVAGPGDTVGWVVELTGTDRPSGTPAHVDIDLSGVLASADLVGRPLVTGPGRVDRRSRSLRWTGELGAGQRARVHFTAAVHRTIEARALSVPAATPVQLRGLELTVRARPDETSGSGPTTFEVTARNVGTGGWTADEPATFDVDLGELRTLAPNPTQVEATAGATTIMGRHLVWTGPLPAGRSVTVTFRSDLAVRPGAEPRSLTLRASSELASGPCTPPGNDRACRAEVRITAPALADGTPPDRTMLYLSVTGGSVLAGMAGAAVLAARRRRRATDSSYEPPAAPAQQERKPAMALSYDTSVALDSDETALEPAHRPDAPSDFYRTDSFLNAEDTPGADTVKTGFDDLYAALDELRADVSRSRADINWR